VGEQIAAAHWPPPTRAGIIHCDIKPGELMIRRTGSVKVWISVWSGPGIDHCSFTSQPPALSATCRPTNRAVKRHHPQAIFFSLVSFLYELVAGKHPFDSGSIFETLTALNQNQPAPPSSLNTFVPANLDALLLKKCWKKSERASCVGRRRANAGLGFFGRICEQLKSRRTKFAVRHLSAQRKLPWLVAACRDGRIGVVSALYFRHPRQPTSEITARDGGSGNR